ncbi:hypothetical protein TNIN_52171 [Trichonephila inaurata madagascariensis]|uniref:Uncharacterized protein n=1 Tax=Trichonephila inaurata madagascariensis TaxID=2747483 RepID=A0A8X6Y4A0_9ARAC|nr:hypothetical protein TNIN_52171 [Trichonephila inaurata madagascariensis]
MVNGPHGKMDSTHEQKPLMSSCEEENLYPGLHLCSNYTRHSTPALCPSGTSPTKRKKDGWSLVKKFSSDFSEASPTFPRKSSIFFPLDDRKCD